jgi:hypothetical protein
MESMPSTDTILIIATQIGKNMNFVGILIYNNTKGFGL